MRFPRLFVSSNSFDYQPLIVMFGSTVSKVTRIGMRASRRIGNLLSAQKATKSQLGYAFAFGAAGVASIYLVHKRLNADGEQGGFLYSWYV